MRPSQKSRRPYQRPVLTAGPKLAEVVAISSNPAPCWVARAAFGEGDIRWQVFRAWLMEDAPAWFRAAYLRHGPAVGAWLAGRDRARTLVRAAMMPAIRRKLAG
jgi:hypothetical protein